MPETFDPYSQWLGIKPHEMPVDHYRLLGVRRFEGDPAVISAAADARMSHVRTFQTGPRALYTQKLLNELSAARVCLLNPGAKASYDQVLEAVLFSSAPPPQFAEIASPPVKRDENVRGEFITEDIDDEGASRTWVAVAAVVIVLLVGAIATLLLRRREPDLSALPANLPQVSQTAESAADEPENETLASVVHQEADGSVNLDASSAQLHGPTLQLGSSGEVNVIDAWESMDDWVSWTFQIVKVPTQGIFRVHVTYAARPESDGGKFVIAVGDQAKVCEIRGTGEPLTDEYFLAVPNNGEHTLTVRARGKPSQRLMTLKSVRLVLP